MSPIGQFPKPDVPVSPQIVADLSVRVADPARGRRLDQSALDQWAKALGAEGRAGREHATIGDESNRPHVILMANEFRQLCVPKT